MIELSDAFVNRTIRRDGDAGERWLATVSGTVAELSRRWSLLSDGEPMYGEFAVVCPVRRDGEPLMLKVSYPTRESAYEAIALRTWDGRGAVHLVESDEQRRALLIERAEASRTLVELDSFEAMQTAAALLRRLAVAVPPSVPTLMEVVDRLTATLERTWVRSGREVPRAVMDHVAEFLEGYFPARPVVLVNTDVHFGNVLAAEREPWLVIDPNVIAGDLEYGIAPLLWGLSPRQLLHEFDEHFETAVSSADVDAALAREWSIVRTVDYWLWSYNSGLTEVPITCRHIVETLLA